MMSGTVNDSSPTVLFQIFAIQLKAPPARSFRPVNAAPIPLRSPPIRSFPLLNRNFPTLPIVSTIFPGRSLNQFITPAANSGIFSRSQIHACAIHNTSCSLKPPTFSISQPGRPLNQSSTAPTSRGRFVTSQERAVPAQLTN